MTKKKTGGDDGVRATTGRADRRSAEQALRESEERYRELVENINDAIYELDAGGRITYISPVIEQVSGYRPCEVIGRPFADFIHPDDLSRAVEGFQRGVSGHPRPNEYRILSKRGEVLWGRSFGRRIFEGDRVVGVRGVLTDITERKRVEEALRESEERYRDLAENLNDAIFEFDTSGRMTYVSAGMQEVSGYSPSEMIGRSFTQFVHPEDLPAVTEKIQKRPFGSREPSEYRLLHKSGEARWVHSLGRPVFAGDRVLAFRGVLTDITERKRAEEALQQSEEHFRSLIENAADMISIYDADGTRRFASPSFERVLGYKPQELIGKSAFDLVHPDDLPAALDGLAGAVRNPGVTHSAEFRLRHKDGSWRSVESVGRVLVDDSGVASIVVNSRDITDRKRAEKALRQSEDRYRTLVENINEAIYELDAAGRVTYVSPAVEEVGGYSPSEIIGRSFADFLHPDDLSRGAEDFQRSVSGHPSPSEYRVLSKGGEVFWVRSFDRPIFEGGRVVGVRGVLANVTERKQAEEALQQSEERYRTLVEAAPDVIYSLSRDGTITSLNSAFESISGWSRDEWLGKHFAPIIHPDDLPAAMDVFRLILRGDVPPVGEYRMLAKSGQYLTVEIVPRPLIVDGKVVATFGIARDISERKRMEEALQSAREELESAVERQMQRGNAYGLTFRELTVLYLVADGRPDREIGTILGISNQTAHKHVASILSKMSVASRTEASVRALREGLLD